MQIPGKVSAWSNLVRHPPEFGGCVVELMEYLEFTRLTQVSKEVRFSRKRVWLEK